MCSKYELALLITLELLHLHRLKVQKAFALTSPVCVVSADHGVLTWGQFGVAFECVRGTI